MSPQIHSWMLIDHIHRSQQLRERDQLVAAAAGARLAQRRQARHALQDRNELRAANQEAWQS